MLDRITIFGATGDLTSRLLLPSLAHLVERGESPEGLRLTGVGVEDHDTAGFRERLRAALAEHGAGVDAAAREAVVEATEYVRGDAGAASDVEAAVRGDGPVLAYLALPPRLFEPTLTALGGAGLGPDSVVAIEKPFGTGVESARSLNELLARELPAPLIFRVDHFLSANLVQNLIALRFANRVFEPVWNGHVERVEIRWDETLALEGRAGYYDHAGALRDMLQNHLLQVLCLVAMEPPPRVEARLFRDARAAALYSIPSLEPAEIAERSVRGRYGAGSIEGREVPAYVDEEGVDPDRGTETYAELTLEVLNWRWSGVPFTLRSGKGLGADQAEVCVHFRDAPGAAALRGIESGTLRIGLKDAYVRLGINVLGEDRTIARSELELSAPPQGLPAYANLLRDMLDRNPMLAITGDEAEQSWRIVEPVLDAWARDEVPLLTYPAGSSGPTVGAWA